MKFENTEVWGFEHALRGMRNPKNSWNKSDSKLNVLDVTRGDVSPERWLKGFPNCHIPFTYSPRDSVELYTSFVIGEEDMKLAQTLIRAGSEHRKFMRQIFVSVDITAPLYWWKEFDTYKVGTVANSTSTMHKITSNPITIDCFEIDDYQPDFSLNNDGVHKLIDGLEELRKCYLTYVEKSKLEHLSESERKHCKAQAKYYWKELIRWLPESWLQTRTVTMNYENLLAMCGKGQRRFHKLNEWSGIDDVNLSNFISWARTLPYSQEFIFIDEVGESA